MRCTVYDLEIIILCVEVPDVWYVVSSPDPILWGEGSGDFGRSLCLRGGCARFLVSTVYCIRPLKPRVNQPSQQNVYSTYSARPKLAFRENRAHPPLTWKESNIGDGKS